MIKTERLILRSWCSADFELFAKMNADPRVREYFPSLLTRQESDDSIRYFSDNIEKNGWGFWALSAPSVADFIGFIGLQAVPEGFLPHLPSTVEIGWRLAHEYWGKGYATEGALAVLKYGFEELHLNEIVAFTAMGNNKSRHVMKKIGMTHDPQDDFNHPKLPEGHKISRHVLYRLQRQEWQKQHLI